MPQSNRRNLVRACLLSAAFLSVFAPAAFSDVVESLPMVLPADGVYALPNTCISVLCLENIQLLDFTGTTNTISGGNQLTASNVDLTANAFANVSGSPGAFITPILLTGQIDITYFSKTELSQQGTFNDLITSLSLTGSFTGLTGSHTISAILNPNQQSTGQTTVTEVSTAPPAFRITSFFDVFTEISLDNGAYVPGPERTADLTPEPAFYVPIGAGLAVLIVARRRAAGAKRLNTQSLAA